MQSAVGSLECRLFSYPYTDGRSFMAISVRSQTALPMPMRFLSLLRRALLWASLVFAFVGVIASIDALQEGLRSPDRHLEATVGTQIEMTLPFDGRPDLLPSDFSLMVTPQTSSLVGQNFAIGKTGKDVLVTLHALPSILPGSYEVRLLSNGNASDPWTVQVYADKRAMQKDSLSYLESLFGLDPLNVTVVFLGLFLFSLLAGFVSHRTLQALFTKKGYLRVFHTKEEGNDTLLYCIDEQRTLSDTNRYPILTATGHLLGFATVLERGRQHCILRLQASHATTGCLIGVQPQ